MQRALVVLGFVAFLGCAVACGGGSAVPTVREVNGEVVWSDVVEAHGSSDKATREPFKGRTVTVEGLVHVSKMVKPVAIVGFDPQGRAFIVLSKVYGKHTVSAEFDKSRVEELSMLTEGQKVRVRGSITHGVPNDNGTVSVFLKDCQLVK